jgi:hypothetical protein
MSTVILKSNDELGCGIVIEKGFASFEYGGYTLCKLSIGVTWEMIESGDGVAVVLVPLLSLGMYRIDREVFGEDDGRLEERIEWFVNNVGEVK